VNHFNYISRTDCSREEITRDGALEGLIGAEICLQRGLMGKHQQPARREKRDCLPTSLVQGGGIYKVAALKEYTSLSPEIAAISRSRILLTTARYIVHTKRSISMHFERAKGYDGRHTHNYSDFASLY
jgi:hypothetical protein